MDEETEILEGTVVKDEKSFSKWWNDRKIVQWFKAHPDASLTLLGGVLSIAGAVAKIMASNKEYEDAVYLTASDDSVYKIPAKGMKTVKQGKVTEPTSVD